MTDREICKKIISLDGRCSKDNQLPNCLDCPIRDGYCNSEDILKRAKQWLKDHTEKYTYAEVDLPEWWDGRPIKGYAWDDDKKNKKETWCCGINKGDEYPYFTESSDVWKRFEPLTETPTTAKVSITKDGKASEKELTDKQIKELGL